MSGLKFDPPQVSPVTEVDRRRFPRFRAYIRRRIAETLPESILQGAITEVVTDAIGTLDSRSEKEAILCVDSNIDLERLLGPLKHQRIPAHLMTWKDEPRSLGVRSVSRNGSECADTSDIYTTDYQHQVRRPHPGHHCLRQERGDGADCCRSCRGDQGTLDAQPSSDARWTTATERDSGERVLLKLS